MPIRVRVILEGLGVLAGWRALGLGWGITLWNAKGVTLWLSGLENVRELVFIASGSLVGKRVGCLLSKCENHQYVCMSKLVFKRSSMRHIENHTCFAVERLTASLHLGGVARTGATSAISISEPNCVWRCVRGLHVH